MSKGPKFVPTPKSPDLLELEKDIKVFVRSLKLKEFFHNFTPEEDVSIVYPKSDFTPTAKSPTLVNICETLINYAENLHTLPIVDKKDNLSKGERRALMDLKNDKSLVIKKADKGNVLVVLEKTFYKNQILSILNDINIYKKHDKNIDSKIFLKVKKFAEKDEYSSILTNKEKKFLTNFNFTTANFYGVPKIHKSKAIKEAFLSCNDSYVQLKTTDLTFRGITGCPNSPTSRLSELLNILLKPFIVKIKSHIKDTTDFLNKFPRFSRGELKDIKLCTVDIVSMYPSIQKTLGLKAVRYFCDKYPDLLNTRFTVDFIIEGLTIVLDDNLCHFDNEYYTQINGTFTGTTVAPTYATITMAYLEILLESKLNNVYSSGVVTYIMNNWKRYLDDGFIAWNINFGDFKQFVDILNDLDNNINFTFEIHNNSISFLNLRIYKGINSLLCDIYYKDTDTREYLDFTSCHAHHIKINIPYNLCRNVCSIVEDKNILNNRLEEMKFHLKKCRYPISVINNAITKARNIDQAVLRTNKISSVEDKNIVFVSTYNPRNPDISGIINSSVERLQYDPVLKNIFSGYNLIKSLREPKSIQDFLVRSNFIFNDPPFGVKKCNKKLCKSCPLVYETDQYNFWKVNFDYKIRGYFDCSIKECIYVLTCLGCGKYYIGKTVNFRERMTAHRGDIKFANNDSQYVYRHIKSCSGGNFYATPFYKVKAEGEVAHCAIEDYFIRKFVPCLNTKT